MEYILVLGLIALVLLGALVYTLLRIRANKRLLREAEDEAVRKRLRASYTAPPPRKVKEFCPLPPASSPRKAAVRKPKPPSNPPSTRRRSTYVPPVERDRGMDVGDAVVAAIVLNSIFSSSDASASDNTPDVGRCSFDGGGGNSAGGGASGDW